VFREGGGGNLEQNISLSSRLLPLLVNTWKRRWYGACFRSFVTAGY